MEKLTGLERILKAVNRQEPDMVPTLEIDIEPDVINAIKPGLSYAGCNKPDSAPIVRFSSLAR